MTEDTAEQCTRIKEIESKLIDDVVVAFAEIGLYKTFEASKIKNFIDQVKIAREFSELRNLACGCTPK